MSDPNSPDSTQPPASAPQPPAYAAPPQAPAYGAAPPVAPQYAQPPAAAPGKTLGIVAFILSFFVQIVGLILGIVALVQSRRVGQKNGWALAAIIISAVLIVLGIIGSIIFIMAFAAACSNGYCTSSY